MKLAGIFNILPALSIIGLLVALYSLYVMYLGLPVLMNNPKEKTMEQGKNKALVSVTENSRSHPYHGAAR